MTEEEHTRHLLKVISTLQRPIMRDQIVVIGWLMDALADVLTEQQEAGRLYEAAPQGGPGGQR